MRVGALALIWSFWLYRNDKVFDDKNCSLLQVIYKYTSMLRSWSPFQRMENQDLFMEVGRDWRLWRGILFSYMGGRIIYRLVHHRDLRRFTIAQNDMYFAFFILFFDTSGWLCAS
jgi:hypothetical protein